MKKIFSILTLAAILLLSASCEKRERQEPVSIKIQLQFEEAAFAVEGITVTLSDAGETTSYEQTTDNTGAATFMVPAGNYKATAVYKIAPQDGERIAYNGRANEIVVKPTSGGSAPFLINLLKVVSQQVIIKEVYNAGCLSADGQGSYASDQYFVIYNNSAEDADASNLVFGITDPYESYSANAYYDEGGNLLYEHESWIPAGGALWWFKEEHIILPPYSQIVIAVSSATNHTAVNPNSVDLSKAEYYWMCNVGLGQMYDRARKYAVDDNIPQSHYLTGKAFAMTPSGWPFSTASPAFFLGRMPRAEAEALCLDSDNYDKTLGAMFTCIKFPKANIVDALEIWTKGNEERSHGRFSADVNSNYVSLATALGYSVYRNVDKEATEALPENAGKLVYNYAGGTDDVEGTTDPSGIDAEASIANGAHIIFSETNDSFIDYHQRKVATLKK